jgi:response regulator RpfG family c-di-GMP phosphodiesterase
MSLPTFTDPETVARSREELASALNAGLTPGQSTLPLQFLARSFVDAYSETILEGRQIDGETWLRAQLRAHAPTPAMSKFLSGAGVFLGTYLAERGLPSQYLSALQSFDESVRRALDACAVEEHRVTAPIDETDAAVHELLVRSIGADVRAMARSASVGQWSARIARRMALNEKQVAFARRCGLLHDVGACGAPGREHPLHGERLVREEPLLRAFATAVRMHHEHLDGSGYPEGLRAASIPIAARIVAVASRFNWILTAEPEMTRAAPGRALDELAATSGKHYDVRVVAALHDVVERGEFDCNRELRDDSSNPD